MHADRPGTCKSLAAAFALCALFAFGSSLAASVIDSMPSIDVVRSRLSLTPEQAQEISPIIERRRSELRASREKLENAASRAEWQALLREAQLQGNAFSAEVEKLLSMSQVSEWRELRSETREKIQERYAEKRDAG